MWTGNIDINHQGRGTAKHPYKIETAEQLAGLAFLVNKGESFAEKYFTLTTDILLNSAEDWDRLKEKSIQPPFSWTPIGTEENPFKGIFDGQNHTISYMFMNRFAPNRGLFGCIAAGAVVKNLKVCDFDIRGSKNVGGLVGKAMGMLPSKRFFAKKRLQDEYGVRGPIIENCTIKTIQGKINGESFVGGLVGYAEEHTLLLKNKIENSEISGKHYVGGLVGWTEGKVQECASQATIIGEKDNIGGLVGVAESGSIIQNCHANVNVQMNRDEAAQDTYTGGLVGWAEGKIENCYAVVSKDTDMKRVAPFLGHLQEGQEDVMGGSVKNCYYNAAESSSDPSDKDATPKTLEELRKQETFVGWDFEKTWKINPDELGGLPGLRCFAYDKDSSKDATAADQTSIEE